MTASASQTTRTLRPLKPSGKVAERYAVIINGQTVGHIFALKTRHTYNGQRRLNWFADTGNGQPFSTDYRSRQAAAEAVARNA